LLAGFPVYARYGGGAGEPDDPYLVRTPQQMNAIGANPSDWDKHFKLTADIDLAGFSGTQFNIIGTLQTPMTDGLSRASLTEMTISSLISAMFHKPKTS
jgi:hypothetical protein